jgi:pimeloyl-ACP methyl ester carboxylesterase
MIVRAVIPPQRAQLDRLAPAGAVATLLDGGTPGFRVWREWCHRQTENGSQLLQTRVGAFECVVEGEGRPVIVLHGLGGGYDHALWIGRRLGLPRRHQVIAISRPGYLRTPLASGAMPDILADGLAALLDALGLARAAVIGSSAGGMSAIRFAIRHPDRCSGVVMLSGVARGVWPARLAARIPLSHGSDLVNWAFACSPTLRHWVSPLFWWALSGDRRRIQTLRRLPALQLSYTEMLATTVPAGTRAAGRAADLLAVARFPRRPDAASPVPALVLHAPRDPAVPFSHARVACQWFPRAVLVPVRDGRHLLPLTHPHLGRVISRFLRQV